MRRIGIFYAYWVQDWDVDFLPFIDKAHALGFEQLELNGGTIVGLSSAERARLGDRASELGIALSYGIGLTPDHDPSSLDEKIRIDGIAFMKRMIDAVAEMGGGMIGGTVHSYWPASPPRDLAHKRAIREQSIRSMRELARHAQASGVVLNVEVINRFEQFLLNTCEEALSFVREVDSPALGILLDTFHMNIEEDSIGGAIRLAGGSLNALHIGEANRRPPGAGRMPWPEIREALDAIGFDGPLVMEPFVVPGGRIGHDIALWRELAPAAERDALAARALDFAKRTLR